MPFYFQKTTVHRKCNANEAVNGIIVEKQQRKKNPNNRNNSNWIRWKLRVGWLKRKKVNWKRLNENTRRIVLVMFGMKVKLLLFWDGWRWTDELVSKHSLNSRMLSKPLKSKLKANKRTSYPNLVIDGMLHTYFVSSYRLSFLLLLPLSSVFQFCFHFTTSNLNATMFIDQY